MVKLVKPQIDVDKALEDPEAWIPRGIFCYAYNFDSSDPEEMTGYLCPFWDLREDKPEYENGYCHYLKRGDWEVDHYSLLYDECKECSVNYDVECALEQDRMLKTAVKKAEADTAAGGLLPFADVRRDLAAKYGLPFGSQANAQQTLAFLEDEKEAMDLAERLLLLIWDDAENAG